MLSRIKKEKKNMFDKKTTFYFLYFILRTKNRVFSNNILKLFLNCFHLFSMDCFKK